MSKRRPAARRGSEPAPERIDSFDGEDYVVRPIRGSSSTKSYRCPGCDLEIPTATPHLVVWPQYAGTEHRRHWHKACWQARERRRPLS